MSVTSLIRGEMAAAMAVALVLGLILLALRPRERPQVRNALLILGLCALVEIADGLMVSFGRSAAAAIAADVASVLIGLVVVRLAALFLFRVLLPAVRLSPARIVEDVVTAAAYVGWGLAWLRLSGVDPASLFATSAVVTAVVAFAMQDTLGNVLGGLLLQFDRSIRVGDWVRIDDAAGRVTEIRWRHTAIETRNGETIIVPNGWMLKNRFMVLSSRSDPDAPWRRWVRVSVDLAAPPGAVCAVLEGAVSNARIPNVAAEPLPSAVLLDMTAHQGNYALRFWIHDRRHDDATDSAVRTHVIAALARHGMKLGAAYSEQLTMHDNEAHRVAERAAERRGRVEAVSKVELFSALSPQERETLADHLVYAPFAAGDVITRQGAVAHWLYLMVSGEAEVTRDNDGQRVHVGKLHEGEVFGEMGMMMGAPRGATVTALTDVVCFRLDKAGFATVLMARPDIAESMSKVLAARQAQTEARVRENHGQADHGAHHEAILHRIREFFGLADERPRQGQATVS